MTADSGHRDPGPGYRAPFEAGLCERCAWVRWTGNRRGAVFALCKRSGEDRRFARYPRLPVESCAGFESAEQAEERE